LVERDDLALSLNKCLSGFTHFVIEHDSLSRQGTVRHQTKQSKILIATYGIKKPDEDKVWYQIGQGPVSNWSRPSMKWSKVWYEGMVSRQSMVTESSKWSAAAGNCAGFRL
jgi:hypothetical protein